MGITEYGKEVIRNVHGVTGTRQLPVRQLYPFSGPVIVKDQYWYTKTWREMSTWLSDTFGWGNWEFYDNQFVFTKEADLVVYLLRWT